MPSSPFDDWVSVFDEDISNAWKHEPEERIKTTVMLMYACKKELQKFTESIDLELNSIRQKLKRKDQLRAHLKLSTSPRITKKNPILKAKENIQQTVISEKIHMDCSPDIFKNLNKNLENSTIVKSSDDTDDATELEDPTTSPTIKKKQRSYYDKVKKKDVSISKNTASVNSSSHCEPVQTFSPPAQLKNIQQNLFNKTPIGRKSDDILDTSIIENTPQISRKKFTSGVPSFKKKRKIPSKSSTLTQMFCKSNMLTKGQSTKNNEYDSDITCIDIKEDTSKSKLLGITDMINLINDNNKSEISPSVGVGFKINKNKKLETNVKSNIDGESEKWLHNMNNLIENAEIVANQESENLNNTLGDPSKNLNEFLAKVNKVPVQLEKEEVVRGKARKNLPGWACKDCEKFYMNQDLTPGELVQKMNQCSKHRSRYRPREETIPGFWDLTMSSQSQD